MTDNLVGEIMILAAKSVVVFLIALAVFRALQAITPNFPDDDGEHM